MLVSDLLSFNVCPVCTVGGFLSLTFRYRVSSYLGFRERSEIKLRMISRCTKYKVCDDRRESSIKKNYG